MSGAAERATHDHVKIVGAFVGRIDQREAALGADGIRIRANVAACLRNYRRIARGTPGKARHIVELGRHGYSLWAHNNENIVQCNIIFVRCRGVRVSGCDSGR